METAQTIAMSINDWITLIFSGVIATAISVTGLFLQARKNKKDEILQTITSNRINWINKVRELVTSFIQAYIDGEPKTKLMRIESAIELYLRSDDEDYQVLVQAMKDCYTGGFSERKLQEVIDGAQYILHRTWVRIKVEGGQGTKADQRVKNRVVERCGTYKEYKAAAANRPSRGNPEKPNSELRT